MNLWHMQLHPGEPDWSREDIFSIVKDQGVIGLGEHWEGDKGQPDLFKNVANIGDIVIIRHQGPLCIVKIISDCIKNEGENEKDAWFPIYRKVELLDSDVKTIKEAYERINKTSWSSGIFALLTFQNANQWGFANFWYNKIKNEQTMKSYSSLLKHNKNLILSGAPGTGKTYLAKQIAAQMILDKPYSEDMEDDDVFSTHVGFTQFHPSYDYTDFVEGLRPTKEANGFVRTNGIFKNFCEKAINSTDHKPCIFIIDEINRGEISKIFGELFFSVDPGYRGKAGKVNTQYQNLIEDGDVFKDGFYVPNNVYIIGTMNDIDRSVESMDFAFRRRFAFKEVYANENTMMLDNLGDLGKKAANRMKHLNYVIWHNETKAEDPNLQSIEGLSSAYHIGASYFLKLNYYKDEPDNGFNSLWEYHIEGVLREYLRGTEDIDQNIQKLKKAFDDDSDSDYGQS